MVTNGKAHDTDRQALAQVVKALVDRSEGRTVAAVGDVLAKDRRDRDELREQLVKQIEGVRREALSAPPLQNNLVNTDPIAKELSRLEKVLADQNAAGALERAKGWAVLKDLVGEIANLPVPVGGPIQVPAAPPATVVVDLSGLEAQLAANTAAVDGLGELVGQWTEALAALAEVLRGAAQSNKALVAALSRERPARKLVVRENEDGTVTVES